MSGDTSFMIHDKIVIYLIHMGQRVFVKVMEVYFGPWDIKRNYNLSITQRQSS